MSFKPLYTYIDRDTLAEKVRQLAGNPSQRELAVIDVRDDDFRGGNIVGARNVPSSTLSQAAEMDKLVAGPLKDYKQVVFHCHLSQQRGPKAAGQYAQSRSSGSDAAQKQEVLVLRGGFSEFQDKYKKDASVVEKYDASSWQYRD